MMLLASIAVAADLQDPTLDVTSGYEDIGIQYCHSRDIEIDISDVNQDVNGDPATVVFWNVSENQPTPPAADAAAWVTPKPTSFTLSPGEGAKTLYVWIRDAVGNMNVGPVSASVTYHEVDELADTSVPGYDENNKDTWPLLAGENVTFTASSSGGTGIYNWEIEDSTGATVATSAASAAAYDVDVEDLFDNYGAGAYTVYAQDANYGDLNPSSFKIRIPMRIEPMTGSYEDSEQVDYEATGGSGDFMWVVTNSAGTAIATETIGAFTDPSGETAADNTLDLSQAATKLTAPQTFRVKATTDDEALVAAGLESVITGAQVVVPVYDLTIQVNNSDGGAALDGVVITAAWDGSTETTDGSGQATFNGLQATGVTYAFTAVSDGYLSKAFTVTDITTMYTVTLEAINGTPATISGTILLNGTPGGTGIYVKLMDDFMDSYLADSEGQTVKVLANSTTGDYSLTFDRDVFNYQSYIVVAERYGYVTNLDEMAGVADGVFPGNTVNIDLQPVTKISVALSADPSGFTFTISATPSFDGTAGEIKVYRGTSAAGTDVTAGLTPGGDNYQYNASLPAAGQSASIYVQADTSTDYPDASRYYFARKTVTYVNGLENAGTATGSATSTGGGTAGTAGTRVEVPIGGLLTPESCTIAITEVTGSGASGITGSGLVDVTITGDDSGEEIGDELIQQIFITISFDPAVVPVGSLEAGTWRIYQAGSLADMLAGNKTAVPVDQLVAPGDYVNGKVTFWVTHLSTFGIGAVTSSGGGTTSGGGGGCFIATAAYGSYFEDHVMILRQLRDDILLHSGIGRAFVAVYYRTSPPIADFIADHDALRAMVRWSLAPVVGLSWVALHYGVLAVLALMLMVLALVSGSGVMLYRMRKK
jgi:hypothetical protein